MYQFAFKAKLRGSRVIRKVIRFGKVALQEFVPSSLICHSEERGISLFADQRFLVPRNEKQKKFFAGTSATLGTNS
jgi:hypothetical protein